MNISLRALALLLTLHCPALLAEEPAPNPETERTLGQIIDDAAINTKIKAALLAEEGIDGLRVNVDTLNGKVTLTGAAETTEQIQTAKAIASQVSGVTSVDNRIAILDDDAPPRVTVRTQVDDAKQGHATRTAGEFIDDAWINAQVKHVLMKDKQAPGLQINVDTMNGVVTLRGRLDSRAEADWAVRLASSIKGVKSIDDQLQVPQATEGVAGRPASPLDSDSAIGKKVKAALTANSEMTKVDVDMHNGVVTLQGEVTEIDHAAKAAEIALATEGVKSVNNQLAVEK